MVFPKIVAFEFFVEAYACYVDQFAVRQNSGSADRYKMVSCDDV